MERLLKFSILSLLVLSACAKSPGFNAEDFNYNRVNDPQAAPGVKAKARPSYVPGSVVRNSNRITFTPTNSEWKEDDLVLKANVKVGDDTYGEVEFTGKKSNSKVLLVPTKPELQDKVKAQVICTSEAGCTDAFIDIFYKDEEILYHDQVIMAPKEEKREPVLPEPEKTPAKDTKKEPKSEPKKDPKKEPPKTTPAAPQVEQEVEKIIYDEVSEKEVTHMGYVGTSDEEAREAFKISEPKKEEKKPVESSPVAQQPQQPKPPEKDKAKTPEKPPTKEPAQLPRTGVSPLEKMRVADQIIRRPDKGLLNRATDFLQLSSMDGFHFFITQPREKRYYGSFDLARVIHLIGEALHQMLPNRKLAITEISQFGGGRLSGHKSHQTGVDADVRYLRHDENQPSDVVRNGQLDRNFMISEQWKLFKAAFATGGVEIIFVDSVIKKALCQEARRTSDLVQGDSNSIGAQVLSRLYILSGHDNHFHIRAKCSRDNPRCQRILINPQPLGC